MRLGIETAVLNGQEIGGGPRVNAIDRVAPQRFMGPRVRPGQNLLLTSAPVIGEGTGAALTPEVIARGARIANLGNINGFGLGANVASPFYGTSVTVRDVADEMTYWAESWMQARGNGTGYADAQLQLDPALAEGRLAEIGRNYCDLYSTACGGYSVPALASQLAARYSAWFQSTFPKGWGNAYTKDQSQASPWATQGNYTQNLSTVQPLQYVTAPANNGVQPSQQYSGGTLNDPPRQQPAQPNLTQPGQQQSQQQQTSGGGGNTDMGEFFKDNWIYFAAAAAALVILPMIGRK